MSKIDDKLNEVLGIAEDVTYENEVPKKASTDLVVPEDNDPEIDFETGRKNLYNLLDKGNEAIDAQEGEVVAVGSGAKTEDGKTIKMDVKIGDRVLFGKWSGTEVKIDGKEYSIMKESDIMGISKSK